MSVRPYVRPPTKRFFDFNEIRHIGRLGRGRRVMHDGMQYYPIQGRGQGREPLKVGNPSISSAIYNASWKLTTDS